MIADAIWLIISYLLVIVLGFLIMNFLSNGFFGTFIIVKASRGKKVLVKVVAVSDSYFVPGEVNEVFLVFKDRKKEDRRIRVKRNHIYGSIGVNCIDIRDEKNAIIMPYGEEVSGFDAVKQENLNKRCLQRPQIKSKREQVMLLVLVALVVGVGIAIYFGYTNNELLMSLGEQVSKLQSTGVVQ